jgi:hypothetical protein
LRNNVDSSDYSQPIARYAVPSRENPDGTLEVPVQAVYLIDPTDTLVTPVSGAPVFNEATGHYEDIRTPVVYKPLGGVAAAGNTAIWTPAAGKRFRLLGFIVSVASGATSAAGTLVSLYDAAVGVFAVISVGTTIPGGQTVVVSLAPNGYLSSTIGNALNLNLSSALTAGVVTATAWGTEE